MPLPIDVNETDSNLLRKFSHPFARRRQNDHQWTPPTPNSRLQNPPPLPPQVYFFAKSFRCKVTKRKVATTCSPGETRSEPGLFSRSQGRQILRSHIAAPKAEATRHKQTKENLPTAHSAAHIAEKTEIRTRCSDSQQRI